MYTSSAYDITNGINIWTTNNNAAFTDQSGGVGYVWHNTILLFDNSSNKIFIPNYPIMYYMVLY